MTQAENLNIIIVLLKFFDCEGIKGMLLPKLLLCLSIALEFLFVPLYLKAVKPGRSRKTLVLKMTCAALFLCCGILSALISGSLTSFSKLILAGLVFGWVGDFFLHVSEKSICLLTGLISFLTGHLLYIGAFSNAISGYFPDASFFDTVETAVFIIFFAAVTVFAFRKRRTLDRAFVPVTLYGAILVLMFVKACSLCIRLLSVYGFEKAIICVIVLFGVTLFVISDVFLAVKVFFGKKESHLLTSLNIITYFAAQHLLALTILYI